MGGYTGTAFLTSVEVYNLSATPVTKTTTNINNPGRYTQIYGTNGGPWSKHAVFIGGASATDIVTDIARITRNRNSFSLASGTTYTPARSEGNSVSFLYEVRLSLRTVELLTPSQQTYI